MNKPLVSILIPNYNYAQYLEQCLESVWNQTYDNFEVIISDNQSTDGSFDIIMRYREKFLEKGIWYSLMQNKRNLGSGGNTAKCYGASEGTYFMWLSSDDFLEPDAVETMVKALEMYPNAGYVMAHRNEVDENGRIERKPSFYNQSCLIPGEEQAAVFMMAGIAVSSQILFRRIAYQNMLRYKHLRFQVAGDWYDNFMMTGVGDVAYIKRPLINYRIHSGNETSDSERNLVGIFEHYSLINAFCTTATSFGMTKPQTRYEEAVQKLGYMCLRYARKMLENRDAAVAEKYMGLASIYHPGIGTDEQYQLLMKCLHSQNPYEAVNQLGNSQIYERVVSYDPPEHSIRIPELE